METKTKTRRVIKSGEASIISLSAEFVRKAGLKKGDVVGLTYNSILVVMTPKEATDREVLAQHPMVKTWETIVPFLVKLHPEYSTCPQVLQSYNEML